MNNDKTALEHSQSIREHIISQFDDNKLSKAISSQEFDKQYSTEHEVYSTKGLNKFINDAVEKGGGESPELVKSIADELSTLKPVLVKQGDDANPTYIKFFVRPMKKSE